ncbi:Ubiquitin carboxyl-terminal hydrolase 6 [Nymphaea thermarum]|nr:Ubiquitin carboxyl-terminal hydrolase 6 [Nymphaea thermarum]
MPTVSVKWQKELFPAVEIDTTQPPYVFKCQLYDLTGVPPERQKIMVKGGLLKDDADWNTLGVKEGHTAGLYNLGNTCYMNSTLQCLHSVPELKSALLKYSNSGRSNDLDPSSHLLTVATRDLFGELDRSVKPVAPMQFWMVLRKKFPQFGQQHNGFYMQQDAEECWSQLLYLLSQSIKEPEARENETVKSLFGTELVSRVHCQESGEESSEKESVYSLKCHISQEVNHLHEGLKHGLRSELEKASPALGRTAVYLKESCIDDLPRQKVDYPLELDVFDFCSDSLRQKLQTPRQILRDEEGAKLGLKANKSNSSEEKDVNVVKEETSTDRSDPSAAANQEGIGTSSKKEMHLTGIYDLVAVLTHKGRSADSGHYVAWVKQENGKWILFDDENPILQKEEDITKLSGGGKT